MKKLNIKNNLVNNRESVKLEFKKTFQKAQKEYIRTICAFANNQGGKIIFGVEDKPRKPVGLSPRKYQDFNEYDSKELSNQINNHLSENIDFRFLEFSQEIDGVNVTFGVLEIFESDSKPIICTTSDDGKKLREGAIYYRYNGESKEIKSQDLIKLIQNEKEKEKKIFLDHISKISKIGVKNVGVFSYDGELFAGDNKIIIDKDTVEKIKFIKEGKFVEKDGAPAVVLKGEIQNMDSLEVVETQLDPNITHPYEGLKSVKNEIIEKLDDSLLKVGGNGKNEYIEILSLAKKFTITYLVQKIRTKLELYNNIEYCWHSQNGSLVKYNESFINKCIEILQNEEELKSILT